MIKISKSITNLLIIGLIIKFIFIFIDQSNFSLDQEEVSFRFYYIVDYFADILLILSGLLAIIFEGVFFERKLINRYYLLVFIISLVYLFSGASIFDFSMFFSSKGIAPIAILSILFTGSNKLRVKYVSRLILIFGIILSFYGILILGSGELVFSRNLFISNFILINLNLMWISFYLLLFFGRNYKKITFSIFSISLIISLVTSTRSFILMHLIFLFYYNLKLSKFKLLTNIATILIGLISYVYLALTSFFSNAFSQVGNRFNTDTRTDQLLQFLLQIDYSDILFGAGSFAEWNWDGRVYQYLDNQILLMSWWAGIFPTILYLSFFVLAIKRSFLKRNILIEYNFISLLIFFWLLALFGLSVYTDISSSLIHCLIIFLLGVSFSKNKYVF